MAKFWHYNSFLQINSQGIRSLLIESSEWVVSFEINVDFFMQRASHQISQPPLPLLTYGFQHGYLGQILEHRLQCRVQKKGSEEKAYQQTGGW